MRKALNIYCDKLKNPVGRPKQTWLNVVLTDISENSDINIKNINDQGAFIEELLELSKNRNKWNVKKKRNLQNAPLP